MQKNSFLHNIVLFFYLGGNGTGNCYFGWGRHHRPIPNVIVIIGIKSRTSLSDFDGNSDLSKFWSWWTYHLHTYWLPKIFRSTKGHVLRKWKSFNLAWMLEKQLDEVVSYLQKGATEKDIPENSNNKCQKQWFLPGGPKLRRSLLQIVKSICPEKLNLWGGEPNDKEPFATKIDTYFSINRVRMNNAMI